MTTFKKVRTEIHFSIHPRYLSDPSQSIYNQLNSYLFKYSRSIGGFPLSFSLEGVTPWGKINDDGSVYVNTLVDFCILKLIPNNIIRSEDGIVMNVFPCVVDGNQSYTGEFRVCNIEERNKIMGTTIALEEF